MKGSMLCVKIALKPDAIVISGIDATLHRKEPLAPDSGGDVRWSPISASIFPQLLEKEQALLCHDRVSSLYKYSGLTSAVHSPHTSVGHLTQIWKSLLVGTSTNLLVIQNYRVPIVGWFGSSTRRPPYFFPRSSVPVHVKCFSSE